MDRNRKYQVVQDGIIVDVKTYPKPPDFSIASVLEWFQDIINESRTAILEDGNFLILLSKIKETGYSNFDIEEVKKYDTLMMIQQVTNHQIRRGKKPKYDYRDEKDIGYAFRETLLLKSLNTMFRSSISDYSFECKKTDYIDERNKFLLKIEDEIQKALLNENYYEVYYDTL